MYVTLARPGGLCGKAPGTRPDSGRCTRPDAGRVHSAIYGPANNADPQVSRLSITLYTRTESASTGARSEADSARAPRPLLAAARQRRSSQRERRLLI